MPQQPYTALAYLTTHDPDTLEALEAMSDSLFTLHSQLAADTAFMIAHANDNGGTTFYSPHGMFSRMVWSLYYK